MNFFEKIINKIKKMFNKEEQLLLNNENMTSSRDDLVSKLQEGAQLSQEEIERREIELTEKAAYNCLVDKAIGLQKRFNETDYRGKSIEKGKYRLQAEETFAGYGHGSELPVSDEEIRIFVEIGYMHEQAQELINRPNISEYEMTPLLKMLNDNNINLTDLEQILRNNSIGLVQSINEEFKQKGGSFVGLNTHDEGRVMKDILRNSITNVLSSKVQEQSREI